MTVARLMNELAKLPAEAEVGILYDGEVRVTVAHVYLAKVGGGVVVVGSGEVAYSDDGRPQSAPSKEEQRYWYTPETEEAR